MKSRPFIILGLVPLLGAFAWLVLTISQLQSVPSTQFEEALLELRSVTIKEQSTRTANPLPLLLRIRFPKQTSKTFTGGFMDRSDVYVINAGNSDVECIAHVRGDQVCYVTFDGQDGSNTLRPMIQELFDGLTVH